MSHKQLVDAINSSLTRSRPFHIFPVPFAVRPVAEIIVDSTEKITSTCSLFYEFFKSTKSEHGRIEESVNLSLRLGIKTLTIIERLETRLQNEQYLIPRTTNAERHRRLLERIRVFSTHKDYVEQSLLKIIKKGEAENNALKIQSKTLTQKIRCV